MENGLTQAELSRRIGIEMASSTAILNSLEAAKLITRVRNTTDRRKINVFLTPAGAALEKALMACAADSNRRASKGLTRREVAQLFALAGQIIANFRTLRAARPISGKTRGGMARKVRPAAAPRGRVRRNMPRAAE